MLPAIELDAQTVARNARAWRSFAGVPVWAVVKSQGYGWGFEALVTALEDDVETYCVSDADELRSLRRWTLKPVVVLSAVEPSRLREVLDAGGLPTVSTRREIADAARWARARNRPLRLRVGVMPAAGWSGLDLAALRAIAPALREAGAQVEVWTHLTDLSNLSPQTAHFEEACSLLRAAGVHVGGRDLSSTLSLAAGAPACDAVRIGVGLFGATGSRAIPGVACALRVVAPVTSRAHHRSGTRIGYGEVALERDEELVTARCGYGDGCPISLAGTNGILSVGMQYVTARVSRSGLEGAQVVLLDRTTNLDSFAARARRLPHEIVTAFGNAARANGVLSQ